MTYSYICYRFKERYDKRLFSNSDKLQASNHVCVRISSISKMAILYSEG